MAASLAIGVLSVRSSPSVAGLLTALAAVVAGGAFSFWPVRGRTGEQWLPLGWRWARSRVSGDLRQSAPVPRSGHRVVVDPAYPGVRSFSVRPPARPAGTAARRTVFGGLSLEGLPLGRARPGGSERPVEIGVVFDAPSRTATAVLAVRGHSFALLSPVDQDARIAAWARVLAAMAREGSDAYRIQWIESCLPDDGSPVRRHWSAHAVLDADTPAGRSYRALVDESSPVTRRHRVLVSVSIHTSRSSRSIRAAGRGETGIGTVLSREVMALHRALDGADVAVEGVLGPRALADLIGEAYACGSRADPSYDLGPGGRRDDGARHVTGGSDGNHPDRPPDGAGSTDDGVTGDAVTVRPPGGRTRIAWPWPVALEPHWDAVRADATWHTTYWIAEWPRVDVTPDFLGPLLLSSLRRTVVMVMEPVSPSRAARQVAQARTADIADGELRRRGGFLVTARQAREKASVEDRDGELADGHAQYRFSGYVTVTADSRPELDAARGAIEQAAGQARIELRLLFGEQDVAFACSLPLGRGLS